MIIVVAVFKAQSGKEAELEGILTSMIPQVQKEEGTVSYTLHRAIGKPGEYLFYEVYKDKDALDFHASTSYFKELPALASPLLAEPPSITLYKDLAAIKR